MDQARATQPASPSPTDHERPSTALKEESESSKKRAKRGQTTAVACLSCRHYKCKCDGVYPTCGNCAAKGRSECTYDYIGGERRTAVLRETIRQLRAENTHLRSIIEEQNRHIAHEFQYHPHPQQHPNLDVFAGPPQHSPLSIRIPDLSSAGPTPLTRWAPASSDQQSAAMGYHPPPQISSDPELPPIEYDPIWSLPGVAGPAHQPASLPSDDEVDLVSSGQAPPHDPQRTFPPPPR